MVVLTVNEVADKVMEEAFDAIEKNEVTSVGMLTNLVIDSASRKVESHILHPEFSSILSVVSKVNFGKLEMAFKLHAAV